MEITIVIAEISMPDGGSYWTAVRTDTGQKIAPWSDADTAEDVVAALERGHAGVTDLT